MEPNPLHASHAFYRRALQLLTDSGIPFLIGGAYALQRYAGIERYTRDLDVFVEPASCRPVLDRMAEAGFDTELTFPHWLGKVHSGDDYVDVIFSSGNAVATVDAAWFEHSVPERVLDLPVRLCPAEEMIWSKSFIMERERFDGADINHIIRARGKDLDWRRLLDRFAAHRHVLLAHLILFEYVYPAECEQVPDWVMEELLAAVKRNGSAAAAGNRVCRGTLLSRSQYLSDLDCGYDDPRCTPLGPMTPEQIRRWTDAAEKT